MFFLEVRKLQVTGGSSFIVTLPKRWVEKVGLKKNDPVGVIVQNDGSLLLTSKTDLEPSRGTKEIVADGLDCDYLFRLLVAAYVTGYSRIVVKAARIDPSVRDCVIKFNNTAIGFEVMEESQESIILKDLLNPAEMPFKRTIRRMYSLVKTMHEEAITALKEGDVALAKDVVSRDVDVDRLHWLIYRQFSMVSNDISLFRKKGITNEDALYYSLMSMMMERIGDHAVILAGRVPDLLDKGVDKKVVNVVSKASDTALKVLDNSMEAWFNGDIDAANENMKCLKGLYPFYEEITNSAVKSENKNYIELGYIAESIRRTGEYAGNISEIVIDRALTS